MESQSVHSSSVSYYKTPSYLSIHYNIARGVCQAGELTHQWPRANSDSVAETLNCPGRGPVIQFAQVQVLSILQVNNG